MRRVVEAVDHRSGARESVEVLQLDDPLEAGLSVAILPEHPGDPPDGWPARSGRSRGGPLGWMSWMSRTSRMLGLQGPLEGADPGSGRGGGQSKTWTPREKNTTPPAAYL